MALARRVVALARAVRNEKRVKVRQPLPRLVVAAKEEKEKQALQGLEELIREELNVKALEVRPDLGAVFTYSLRPKFDRLGPKFGKEAKAVAEELKEVRAEVVVQLANGELAFVEMKTGRVHREDVEIARQEKPGWAAKEEEGLALALDLSQSEALRDEGFAREFVHLVQAMRKEARYQVADRIDIVFQAGERLKQALRRQEDYVKRETLALTLVEGDGPGDIAQDRDVNGERARISLSRKGGI
jgi:isoleucyl-tRNA synthetase